MFKILIPIILIILNYSFVFAEDQCLCVTNLATGFSYDNSLKQWKNANFEIDTKYIVSKAKEDGFAFVVRRIGEDYPIAKCKNTYNKYGYLFCEGFGTKFKLNRKNNRFIYIYDLGYYNVVSGLNTDEKSDTPYMEIGKCSKF